MKSSPPPFRENVGAYLILGTLLSLALYISGAIWSRLIVIMAYGWSGYHDKGIHLEHLTRVFGGNSGLRFSNGDPVTYGWGAVFSSGWMLSFFLLAFIFFAIMGRFSDWWARRS
jgi:hypothetical protein